MKRIRTILSAALIAVLVLFSAGCGDDSSDEGGGVNSGELIVGPITEGVPKYYSLTTGEEVSGADIKTGKWDISFTRTRLIQTNSGSTADDLASGGKGGVWHTEKFDMSETVLTDRVQNDPVYGAYNVDTAKWVYSMSKTPKNNLNVMTYLGYQEGDGSSAEAGKAFKTFQYNQKQYYVSGYAVTKRVYIIRHGDGIRFSKIQISEYEYNSGAASDSYVVQYENF